MLPDFLEDLPQVAHGNSGVEGCENLEAGHTGLDRLANLAESHRRYGPGQDVVEGVVGVRVATEDITPHLDLAHYRVGWRYRAWSQRQRAGKVDVGGDATEGGGAAGCLGRLGVDAGVTSGPVIGDWHVDMGVGLNAAREDDHPGGVNGLPRSDVVQRAGGSHGGNQFSLDANVHLACAPRRDHGPTLDNQVQHDCLPIYLLGSRLW